MKRSSATDFVTDLTEEARGKTENFSRTPSDTLPKPSNLST